MSVWGNLLWHAVVCVCVCIAPSRIVSKVFFFFFFFPLHSKHLFSVSWDLMIHLRSWHTHTNSRELVSHKDECAHKHTRTDTHSHSEMNKTTQDHTDTHTSMVTVRHTYYSVSLWTVTEHKLLRLRREEGISRKTCSQLELTGCTSCCLFSFFIVSVQGKIVNKNTRLHTKTPSVTHWAEVCHIKQGPASNKYSAATWPAHVFVRHRTQFFL